MRKFYIISNDEKNIKEILLISEETPQIFKVLLLHAWPREHV